MKRFRYLDGKRSVLVSRDEWQRRTDRQDARIRAKGLVPFRNRENQPYALNPSEYSQRVTMQRVGRFYASNSYENLKKETRPEVQRKTVARMKKGGFIEGETTFPEEKFYTGPTAVVSNFSELGEFMAEVHDIRKIIERVDGRPSQFMRTQLSWTDVSTGRGSVDSFRFISNTRQGLTKTQSANDIRNTLALSMSLDSALPTQLTDILRRMYLRGEGAADGETGELIEGDLGRPQDIERVENFPPVEVSAIFAVVGK